ncbi:MAG TPA: amidohydrolase family protein, partial [Clostridia bacterium]|nr:amidohydrolase family protein [Clostridia bacterium]
LQNMVQTVGIPLEEALPMYTLTPARRIGQTRRGRLEAGCFADVVVLDGNLDVRAVWAAGKRVK